MTHVLLAVAAMVVLVVVLVVVVRRRASHALVTVLGVLVLVHRRGRVSSAVEPGHVVVVGLVGGVELDVEVNGGDAVLAPRSSSAATVMSPLIPEEHSR